MILLVRGATAACRQTPVFF